MLYDFVMEKLSERLPKEFLERLKNYLSEENYSKYMESINSEPVRGVRINTNRVAVDDFLKTTDLNLTKIEFSTDGFMLNTDEKLGNSAEHLSGQIYLQEPSSMLAVCSSGIEKECRPLKVLDLCASPGGKTGQIASRISEDSILFSNEIIRQRAEVLHSNIERLGYRNVVVLNEEPKNLKVFEGYFDYVFVDAPCSGEGMFRKNPETILEWSSENIAMCAERQKEILEIAQNLVCEGGKLIYSTCTFASVEDEEIVDYLLENFDLKILDVPKEVKNCTLSAKLKSNEFDYARKFYPFSGKGEGQFVAVFQKINKPENNYLHIKKHYKKLDEIGKSERVFVDAFYADNMLSKLNRRPYKVGSNVFLAPTQFDNKLQTLLDELKFLSLGVLIGSIEKGRFEPNHNLFMAYHDEFKCKVELEDSEVKKYLHGEELSKDIGYKGYAVVTKGGCPLGGVKISGGKLKNLYPKGLRI